ncbi:hypothetical protein XANMN_17265 [Xanthomonas phaseoli pv. manihotis str. CIO151]|nr:hypothetical protein XANMN_17265 [Xanthomonas phaseoli pv. manihotis str. CIO151]
MSRHWMRHRAADQLSTPINLARSRPFHANASVCGGHLHAYRPGMRRKYVHVGAGAASMPLKVPRRHAYKHHRLSSIAERNAKGLVVCKSFGASLSLAT